MDAIYRGFELLGFRRREDFGPGGPYRGLSSPASLPIGKAFWADFSHFPMFHLKIPNSNKKILKIPKSKSQPHHKTVAGLFHYKYPGFIAHTPFGDNSNSQIVVTWVCR